MTTFKAGILSLTVLVGFIFCPPVTGQQPTSGITLNAQTGNAPVLISSVAGTQGTTTAYYVVIANFPGGSIPSNIVTVNNTPNTLSSSNYVSFLWNAVPGATTYDLLKLTSAALPSGSNSVLLHGSLSATTTTSTDQGSSLSSYTIASTPSGGTATITLNARDYVTPAVEIMGNNGLKPGNALNGQPLTGAIAYTATTDATTTGVTLSAAKMINGLYLHAPTGAVNDTTDTAAHIVSALPTCFVNGNQSTSFEFTLINNSAGANTITIVAGTNVTLSSSVSPLTVAQNTEQRFRAVVTACTGTPAVTLYSLGNAITW